MTTLQQSNWKVFCPRCGDHYSMVRDAVELRRTINRPCRKCGKLGCDALELVG